MNLTNKLVAGFTAMSTVVMSIAPIATFAATDYTEDSAYPYGATVWAINNEVTANPTVSAAAPFANITREQFAAIAVRGFDAIGVELEADDTLNCEYADLDSAEAGLQDYVVEACQKGLFQDADDAISSKYNPKAKVSEAVVSVIFCKALFGADECTADAGDAFYARANEINIEEGVMAYEKSNSIMATRGMVFQMFKNVGEMEVVDPIDPIDPVDPVDTGTVTPIVKAGSLDVVLSPSTPAAAEVPAASSGLPVAKFDFTAGDKDVTLNSVKFLRKGFSDTNTLDGVALTTDMGRVTKARNENSSDSTVELSFNNGGYIVKAGTTVTFTVVATVGMAATASNDTFGFQIVTVNSSAETVNATSAVSPLMRVGSQDAPLVDFTANGSSSSVKIGQTAAEVAKFKITNNNSDQTVTLKSLTLEEVGTIDENTELKNFALYIDGVQFGSTVASTMNKYVTFTSAAGKVINTNNNVKLVVKADVTGGAGKTVRFELDNELDLLADGSKFGAGVGISGVAPIQAANAIAVDAGEVTLDDVDAASDKMREDKDDVVLGRVKITNVAGKALEMQQFGVKVVLTPGAATTVGAVPLTLANLFENFELYNESNGSTYELDLAGNVYSDGDLNVALAQGTTTFAIRADTKKDIAMFDTASVKLDLSAGAIGANGGLYIIETNDDTQVTDITPSALSWKATKGTEAGAVVAITPLANVSKVRGSNDVVALQYTVEADESSALTIDEVKAMVTANGVAATNAQIKEVALYKGTVEAGNLLDKVSGSQLAAGVATFDGFNTMVAADATQSYVITVSIVDGNDAVLGSPIKVALVNGGLSVEDDENDAVAATYPVVLSNRNIAVTNAGTLTVTADANNVDNKDPKTILAGTSMKVFSVDVQASNENVDAEEVVFTVDTDLTQAVTNASLYLGDTLIATNTNADITATTIKFKNLTTLIMPQETKELRLELNTATIGFEKVGATKTAVNVTQVAFNTVEGVDSGKPVVVAPLGAMSQDFAIVPVKVTASLAQALSASNAQARLTITIDKGNNTVDLNNAAPQATLTDLVFSELGNNADGYKIYKEGNAALFGTISSAGVFAQGTMPANDLVISTSATYVIVPTGTADKTYSLVLSKNGVEYDVAGVAGAMALTSNAVTDLELGSRTY